MASQRIRLIRLLDRGFYPGELPPPFRTRNFSDVRDTLPVPQNYVGSTTFFDGATFRDTLRTFGVINPANYLLLSRYLAEKWLEISSFFRMSTCSGARPKFPTLNADGRAIQVASLAAKRKNQRHLASAYPVIVGLDINRFYGSIYTHSIPWAVLGKQEAKRRYRQRTLSSHWSDRLDTLTRNCNQAQTVGIPIGPDTSRIISELLLTRIDMDLTAAGSCLASPQIYHNIDDYQIGAMDLSEAENAQSCFVRAISCYELRLNDFKTSVEHGLKFAPSNFQRHFDVVRYQKGKNFVEHLFEALYAQMPQHPNTNVVGYALKRFARQLAANREVDLVREYLQRLIFATPHQARWILPLLLGIYTTHGATGEVRRLIAWGIETCARRNDVGSLLWFLYASIFLRIKVSSSLCSQCMGMSNELVDLVLMHGKHEGLFSPSLAEIRRRYLNTDFKSAAWLPLYEIGRRGWDVSPAFSKIGTADDADQIYEFLRLSNVEFYLTDPNLFSVEAFDGWGLTQPLFSGDAPVAPEFPFDIEEFAVADDWENYE